MSTYTIELEVDGSEDAIDAALEAALDDGVLQDAINNYDHDDGPLEVTSACQVHGWDDAIKAVVAWLEAGAGEKESHWNRVYAEKLRNKSWHGERP